MSDDLRERLDELEIRFTHQARTVEELNAVVTDCHLRLARLESENGRLREMLKRLAPEFTQSPDE
jgi:SlyX protein